MKKDCNKNTKCIKTKKCNPLSGRCIKKKSYNFWKLAKNHHKVSQKYSNLSDEYGSIWPNKWEKYKLKNSNNIDVNLPLEFTKNKEYGKLDYYQKKFICKDQALDLVLIGNADELFRQLCKNPVVKIIILKFY